MNKMINALRGMHDVLPHQTPTWQWVERCLMQLCDAYGYQAIRLPILEQTELFQRSVGSHTDIVSKEMYSFNDRDKRSITLRPEGTAGCVRACIQHGLIYNQSRRLYYLGPMFRHERPQKGRYRQFWQFGLEAFGMMDADIEAEQLLFTSRLWALLGIQEKLSLQVNSIGTTTERLHYRQVLIDYFEPHIKQLSETEQQRLKHNPLRLLDSKQESLHELIKQAPKLTDYLGKISQEHFQSLCQHLSDHGILYQHNPCLVRGLDYYSGNVVEWVTESSTAQNAVCAGGRYDDLITKLQAHPTPAFGLSIGLERIINLIDTAQVPETLPHLYFISLGVIARKASLRLTEDLRTALPKLRLIRHSGAHSIKQQMKRADQSGAIYACLLDDDDYTQRRVILKHLRKEQPQIKLPLGKLTDHLKSCLEFNPHAST